MNTTEEKIKVINFFFEDFLFILCPQLKKKLEYYKLIFLDYFIKKTITIEEETEESEDKGIKEQNINSLEEEKLNYNDKENDFDEKEENNEDIYDYNEEEKNFYLFYKNEYRNNYYYKKCKSSLNH